MSVDSDGLTRGLVEAPEVADAMLGSKMKRFVVLQHDVGPRFERTSETHLDWMFATGEALSTWSTELVPQFKGSFDTPCLKLADHRLVYLDREGDLGGDRGRVRRVLAGEFTQVASALPEVTFKAALRWQANSGVRYAVVEIGQRSVESDAETEAVFELRFSSGR